MKAVQYNVYKAKVQGYDHRKRQSGILEDCTIISYQVPNDITLRNLKYPDNDLRSIPVALDKGVVFAGDGPCYFQTHLALFYSDAKWLGVLVSNQDIIIVKCTNFAKQLGDHLRVVKRI